jgi:hypothetical protein
VDHTLAGEARALEHAPGVEAVQDTATNDSPVGMDLV